MIDEEPYWANRDKNRHLSAIWLEEKFEVFEETPTSFFRKHTWKESYLTGGKVCKEGVADMDYAIFTALPSSKRLDLMDTFSASQYQLSKEAT